jgi:hypothetical protein
MLREAMGYPLRGDHAVETLLVGGGLHLLAVFVPALPLVPVVGYLVVALGERATTARPDLPESHPPTFRDPRRLLRLGLGGSLVAVAYLWLPAVLLVVTIWGAASGSLPAVPGAGGSVAFVVATTVVGLTAVALAYPLPAALAAYAEHGTFRAAISPGVLRPVVTDARYFVASGLAVVVLGLAAALYAPLNAVGGGFFLAFYAESVAVALWGRGVVAPLLATGGDADAEDAA